MKLHSRITINGKPYNKGDDVPWWFIYPFFGLHMLMFGGSGFLMAYMQDGPPLIFLYMHGGIAILVYILFYFAMFGRDQVLWMFINAAIGVLAIYTQIDWILGLFDKQVEDYSVAVHAIPFLYFVLYTFLLRQALLDITGARDDEYLESIFGWGYVAVSVGFYLLV